MSYHLAPPQHPSLALSLILLNDYFRLSVTFFSEVSSIDSCILKHLSPCHTFYFDLLCTSPSSAYKNCLENMP